MKQKELSKTFMMIINYKKALCSPWFKQKYFTVLRVHLKVLIPHIDSLKSSKMPLKITIVCDENSAHQIIQFVICPFS